MSSDLPDLLIGRVGHGVQARVVELLINVVLPVYYILEDGVNSIEGTRI